MLIVSSYFFEWSVAGSTQFFSFVRFLLACRTFLNRGPQSSGSKSWNGCGVYFACSTGASCGYCTEIFDPVTILVTKMSCFQDPCCQLVSFRGHFFFCNYVMRDGRAFHAKLLKIVR